MKQKTIGFTVLLLLCLGITTLKAQQSANAAGGDATGAGGSASYTVGQVAYTSLTGTNGSSNQGVQQPYEFFITGIDNNPAISLSMSVFPNPTLSTVNLKVERALSENMLFQLYDMEGRQLLEQRISGSLTVVPMQPLAAGSYLLKVMDAQNPLKTFTIIKNN